MFRKAYIVNFDIDRVNDSFDYQTFHNSLTTAKGVINWWHYIESSYILIVEGNITASNISDYVIAIMPNKYFFVSELNLNNHNGWLPQKAWDWINNYKN